MHDPLLPRHPGDAGQPNQDRPEQPTAEEVVLDSVRDLAEQVGRLKVQLSTALDRVSRYSAALTVIGDGTSQNPAATANEALRWDPPPVTV
jgi:hypothetical protein